MSYDTKCLQLARDFLRDEPAINDENHAHELAQEIQDTIEDFMRFRVIDAALAKNPGSHGENAADNPAASERMTRSEPGATAGETATNSSPAMNFTKEER